MPKYKVLLPTNGFAPGAVIDIADEVADGYNAGELTPRVEKVIEPSAPTEEVTPESPSEEAPEAEAPAEGDGAAPIESEGGSESANDAPSESDGEQSGAGAESAEPAAEGGDQ